MLTLRTTAFGREFITLLGGAAVAWPAGARAQQDEQTRRIGVLKASAADDPVSQARFAAFLVRLVDEICDLEAEALAVPVHE